MTKVESNGSVTVVSNPAVDTCPRCVTGQQGRHYWATCAATTEQYHWSPGQPVLRFGSEQAVAS